MSMTKVTRSLLIRVLYSELSFTRHFDYSYIKRIVDRERLLKRCAPTLSLT